MTLWFESPTMRSSHSNQEGICQRAGDCGSSYANQDKRPELQAKATVDIRARTFR